MERIRRLALKVTGIELLPRHCEVMERRCKRLGIRDDAGLDALLDAVDRGDAEARGRLIGLLTTNVSAFFRHPRPFDIAAEHALWAAHQRGTARLWSAAASTGDEPYSLAMSLIDVFRRDDPPVTILATDIDEHALAIARRGEYAEAALTTLPPRFRERFFTATDSPGRWRVAPPIRSLVEFSALNLVDSTWPVAGPLDVVFCRNVLMYLEDGRRVTVLERMALLLAPEGLLILDPAEHLGRAGPLFARGTNGVHTRKRTHDNR